MSKLIMKKNPLILLHGAIGSKEQFKQLIPELEPFFFVYTFDFEGHGGIESQNDFSINLFTNNLLDFIKKEQLTKPFIFGYSMGGYVALNFASKFPNELDKIITYGTKFDWNPEDAEKEASRLNPIKIQEKVPQFAQSLAKIHGEKNWSTVVDKTAKMMLNLGNGESLNENDFSTISNKVLITIGSKDAMVSIEESKSATNQIKNSNFLLLEDFTHPIEQNDLKIISKTIIDYLLIEN